MTTINQKTLVKLKEFEKNDKGDILPRSLAQKLIERFSDERVVYCHWKSNIDLANALDGNQDLDLLISRDSLACATNILLQLGFKQATSKWASITPGVFHYFGYDPNMKELVHLHIFTQVLTGESFLKSHLLPFEEMLLNNTRSVNGMRVVAKEAELVMFVLRTYIKYSSLLDTVRLLRSDIKLREEAQWLTDGSDMELVMDYLERFCPSVNMETFNRGLNMILEGVSYSQKLSMALRFRRRLRAFEKYSLLDRFLGYATLLTGTVVKKVRRQKGGKILSTGGAVIGIVGPDATGKSTLVAETSHWLRSHFVVNTIHAGKPPSTLLTFPVNLLLTLGRRVVGKRTRSSLKGNHASPSSSNVISNKDWRASSLMLAVRALCLAWDRYALLRKARRASARGEIVVCDRYPIKITGAMDGPRLLDDPTRKGFIASIYHWMARMEWSLYQQIPPPDIVLRLHVSLETAQRRNASRESVDDENYLQRRHQQAGKWSMPGTRSIQDIDTDLPLTETLLAVKQAVWHQL